MRATVLAGIPTPAPRLSSPPRKLSANTSGWFVVRFDLDMIILIRVESGPENTTEHSPVSNNLIVDQQWLQAL